MIIKKNEPYCRTGQFLHEALRLELKLKKGYWFMLAQEKYKTLAEYVTKDITVGVPSLFAIYRDELIVYPKPDKDYEAVLTGTVVVQI